MKIVPSEFSNSAWNCFIFAKEIAYKNYQQNVDSDNLLLALIKDCLLYTSPSPRDHQPSRMPSSA